MEYYAPFGSTDPDASYVDKDVPGAVRGSAVPAKAIEHPQREIVALIDAAGFTPDDADLTQLLQGVRSQALNYAADAGTADAMVVTLAPALAAYTAGLVLRVVKSAAANATTTPTLNVNGLGAKTIKRRDGSALEAGDLRASSIVTVLYDGTNFRLQGMVDSDVADSPLPAFFFARASAATTIAAGAWTKINLAEEVVDAEGWYNPANSRFTPLKAGYYLVGFTCTFASDSSLPTAGARIYHNGTVANAGFPTTVFGSQFTASGSGMAALAVGLTYLDGVDDYLEAFAFRATATGGLAVSNGQFWGYHAGAAPL